MLQITKTLTLLVAMILLTIASAHCQGLEGLKFTNPAESQPVSLASPNSGDLADFRESLSDVRTKVDEIELAQMQILNRLEDLENQAGDPLPEVESTRPTSVAESIPDYTPPESTASAEEIGKEIGEAIATRLFERLDSLQRSGPSSVAVDSVPESPVSDSAYVNADPVISIGQPAYSDFSPSTLPPSFKPSIPQSYQWSTIVETPAVSTCQGETCPAAPRLPRLRNAIHQ